ncbi:sensor domain-containing diguanylate cyclase [Massilia sp. LC238]|uniref:sensor domain-containing diguanylate cyclase n=1 Tax=Massilia sp. LC238 TaxID=1502852 RepID=UPI0004E35F3F|nr:sensor domain-containing diguanylate cyclase [Massilia sp. LC238]KFC62337.1 Diguanylate cyclase domain-containing protein [Massilia sp. LC238]
MLKLNTWTLRFRITALVVVLSTVSAFLVALASLNPVEYRMKAVVGNEVQSLVASAANLVGRDIRAKRVVLKSIAEHLSQNLKDGPGSVETFLRTHRALNEEFFNVVILKPNGELIANMEDEYGIGSTFANTYDFFKQTVSNRASVVSEPFNSPMHGEPAVVITQPVFDAQGQMIFVIVGGIDLRDPRLLSQLNAVKPGKTGYFFILDAKGNILQHPNKKRILANVFAEPGGPTPTTAAALRGFEGWREGTSKDGRRAIIAYKRINEVNWIMGSVYPTAEAFAGLSEARANIWLASAVVATAATILGLLAAQRFLTPLTQLRQNVGRITEGSAEIDVLDIARKDEVGDLSRAFFALSQQRATAEGKLSELALTDPLTGIGNRRKFEMVTAKSLSASERSSQPLMLAYLDVDNFKQINDKYGHGIGDQVLIEFAKRLTTAVRASDTVVRLAGDEFVILYDTMAEGARSADFANRVLENIRLPFEVGDAVLSVTTSIGLAFHAGGATTISDLLRLADEALYIAKRNGRNTFAVRSTSGNLPIHKQVPRLSEVDESVRSETIRFIKR